MYHAYNKPLAVLDWMSKVDVKEDFVLVIDADMIMREAFDPAVGGGWRVLGAGAAGGGAAGSVIRGRWRVYG